MNFFSGSFFGGDFFSSTPAPIQTVFVSSGGGEPLGWQDHVIALHKKKMLESDLKLYGRQLKAVQKEIKVQEKKPKKEGRLPEGVLSNLWKLEQRQEAVKTKIRVVQTELVDIQTLLIAAEKQKEYEEEDDDISMLMLL